MVDEYRTSRVCSNRCILESLTDEEAFDDEEKEVEDDAVNFLEEDEGGGGGDEDSEDSSQQNTRRAEYPKDVRMRFAMCDRRDELSRVFIGKLLTQCPTI
jgi:hypothetical protein